MRQLREQRGELPPMESSTMLFPPRPAGSQGRQPPASPHHAGHHAGLHDESAPATTAPQRCDPPALGLAGEMDDLAEQETISDPPRLPTSSRRYQPLPGTQQQNRTLTHRHPQQVMVYRTHRPVVGSPLLQAGERRAAPRLARRARVHWLVWLALSWLVPWWQVTRDDLVYGRPRTFQVDAVVGHGDSAAHPSHFLVLNLSRQIEVIEFPGGDSAHAKIYTGPTLIGVG